MMLMMMMVRDLMGEMFYSGEFYLNGLSRVHSPLAGAAAVSIREDNEDKIATERGDQ